MNHVRSLGTAVSAVRFRAAFVVLTVTAAFAASADTQKSAAGHVVLERVIDGGIQPQAVVDAAGVVHVVFFKGDPAAGNLYYVRRTPEGYSKPVRVNSRDGSAIALGSVRGAQLALGRANRAHVVWNGSDRVQPRPSSGMPLEYARTSDSGRFEPERNLVTSTEGLDAGGTLAADGEGRVFVAWHANATGSSEADAAVYVRRSEDEGRSFAREQRANSKELGACGCCGMRGLVDRAGSLYFLYRAATNGVNRDMTLLFSRDHGATFSTTRADPWKLEACPLSSAFLAEGPQGVTAAWETRNQIFFGTLAPSSGAVAPPASPAGSGQRKHPALAYNARGEALLAWLEDTSWARGGSMAWQLYDRDGRATPEHGSARGVPPWGLVAVAPLRDGRWLLLY